MALYEYSALTGEGKLLSGTIQAQSPDEAVGQLEALSLEVRQVGEAPAPAPSRPLARSELLLFNEQLASIVDADLPLEEALSDLADDLDSRRLSRALRRVVADLKAGHSLDDALARQEKVFGSGYAATVRAGLRSGRLGQMLHSFARHMKMQQDTRRIIAAALAYPLSVLVFGVLVLTCVSLMLVPFFDQAISSQSSAEVDPAQSPAWLMAIAPCLALLIMATLACASFWLLRFWEWGRHLRSRILLSFPAAGNIRWHAKLAQLADTLAEETLAGHDLPQALRSAGATVQDAWAKRECELVAFRLEQGQSLEEAAAGCRFLPGLMILAMTVSAQRQSLPEALYELAEGYYAQAEAAQERLRIFLFPLAVIIVGFVLGTALVIQVRSALVYTI